MVPDNFNINVDGILGKDFLSEYSCNIDYAKMTLTVNNDQYANVLKLGCGPDNRTIIIPARSEVIREFKLDSGEDCVVHNHDLRVFS